MHFIAAAVLVAAVAGGPADSTDSLLSGEIDRLGAILTKVEPGVPKDLSELVKAYRDALERARAAKTPLLRLYRLRGAYSGIESLAFLAEHQAAGQDLDAFRTFWNGSRARFEKPAPPARGSVVKKALQEAATNRAEKLFRASIAYAKVDSAGSGVYYVSEAEGNLRFREFVQSLPLDVSSTAKLPTAAKLGKALDALQGEAIQAFEKEPTGRSLLSVSAKLKETRELLDGKRLEAATLMLLESRLELSKRAPRPQTAQPAPAVGGADDEVIALWSEIADLESPDNSRIIRADVISLYTSLVRSSS